MIAFDPNMELGTTHCTNTIHVVVVVYHKNKTKREGTWREGTWREGTWREGTWREATWREMFYLQHAAQYSRARDKNVIALDQNMEI